MRHIRHIYIYIHVRVHYMVAIIVLNGCSRIRTQLFQTCGEKMERKGEGAFSVSLFSVSSFFWKFVRRDGSFSLLIPLFPPPPFFPFIHPSHWFVHFKNWDAFNCSEADLARFRIDRLRSSFLLSLSNFYPAVISSSDRYVEADIVGSTRINSKFALFLLLFLFPG